MRALFPSDVGPHEDTSGLSPSIRAPSQLQAWIEQNVYLSRKSVPFSKDDEALLPEAGSCTDCPKRTGSNTLLFSEVRQDS